MVRFQIISQTTLKPLCRQIAYLKLRRGRERGNVTTARDLLRPHPRGQAIVQGLKLETSQLALAQKFSSANWA